MTSNSLTGFAKSRRLHTVLFMLLIGAWFGVMGALLERQVASLLSAALLLALYGAYVDVLKSRRGIMSGLVVGMIIGVIIGLLSYFTVSDIQSVGEGAMFGLFRGLVIGGIVGYITRAHADKGDHWFTAVFLLVGSVFLGAVLGASVGLVSGVLLSLIQFALWGKALAVILGAIVGGYLGTYYKERRSMMIGAIGGMILAAISVLIGGSFAGVVLGMMSGALAPIMLMGAIGLYGGSSRGLMAMLVEALEAPSDMIQQGAVPFLAPSVIVGIIVGTAATGAGGMLALTVSLAAIGLLLGVIRELEGHANNRVTMRKMIELVILGEDDWPVDEMIKSLKGANRNVAIVGAITGVIVGAISSAFGVFLGTQVIAYISTL